MGPDSIPDPSCISIDFRCLRARQPIGDIYIASIPYKTIERITFFDVRRVLQESRDFERYLGIQRPLDNKRVDQIGTYVNLVDASFPSSVIIALEDDYVSFDESSGTMTVRNYRVGETEPSSNIRKTARVIDGQHRIAGLEEFTGDDFDLSATIFVGADISDQAHIFATVNLEQTKVNKSLVYDLYELARLSSPQKTCHNIVVALDRDPQSPFYKRVKRLGLATEGRVFEPITQSTLVDGIIAYISGNPREDRDRVLRGRALTRADGDDLFKRPLRNLFVAGDELGIIRVIYNYFTAVRSRWPVAWDERGQGYMLNRTNGVRALLKYFRYAYLNVASPGDMVSADKFLDRTLRQIPLSDSDFTIDNFPPGTGGEAKLFRILRGKDAL